MDWIERLNGAVDYIEEHLTEDISYERLGQIACCSSHHFQRMFGYMAELPLSEYVRRRRMSLAGAELSGGGAEKIVDLALKYGYDSPTAFNRAFQSVHGFPPSQAKAEGSVLRYFPPIRFQITIKGAAQMDYRIETREAFRIVGISVLLEKELEKNFEKLPAVWGKASADGTIQKLVPLMDGKPAGVLGICTWTGPDSGRYFIAVASTLPAGSFEEYTVPASMWAIFSGQGLNLSIQALEKRIFSEWLPSSGYEYGASACDIEVYLNADPQNAQYEVWVPVTKK